VPKAAGHVGTLNSDPDENEVTDKALARIQARIDRDLTRVERAVSTLFDRELEPTETLEALELCDALGVRFGTLGFGVSAELIRRVGVVLDGDGLGISAGVEMASMLEDARIAMASTIQDARSISLTGPALTVVGKESDVLDDLLWVAAAQGMPVNHIVEGVVPGDQDAAALVLVADHPDLAHVRPLLRGLRERYPVEPIIVLTPPGSLTERESVVDLVTTIMPRDLAPAEVVLECRRAAIRASYKRSVSVLGEEAEWVAAELDRRGLSAKAEDGDEDLLMSLQSGTSRAALLLPQTDGLASASLLRAIRSDRTLRPAVVCVVAERGDQAARHQIQRDGADFVFTTDADLDEVVVSLKAALQRRADLEAVVDAEGKHGAVPWANAAVLIERLLTSSFRRNASMGVGVLGLRVGVGPNDLDEQIAREFRRDDVVARYSEDQLVLAVQGVGKRTLLKRINDIHQKYRLTELGVRSAGVEFPVDGRSVAELLQRAEVALTRSETGGGPAVVGADWVPDAARAADVLIVDPDETLGAVLVPLLERKGLRADHEVDALDALDLLTGRAKLPLPALVLLELDLIGVDGLSFLRQIRDAGTLGRLRIVILSARTAESDLRQAFELGAEDFVSKPFSTPLLLHRIQRSLDRS